MKWTAIRVSYIAPPPLWHIWNTLRGSASRNSTVTAWLTNSTTKTGFRILRAVFLFIIAPVQQNTALSATDFGLLFITYTICLLINQARGHSAIHSTRRQWEGQKIFFAQPAETVKNGLNLRKSAF